MSSTPLVSILVPVYNVEVYIERCARSVFEQTYTNVEFVFVDDGSTDSSITILKKVIVEYPCHKGKTILIQHQRNRGLAVTRNTAVDACHGDYILHIDSDDWIESNAVELLVKRQQETNADIVYTSGYYRHGKETKEVNLRCWSTDKESLLTSFLQDKATICIWSKLIKRNLYIYNDITCDECGSYYEDFQTLSRLIYYSKKIACLDSFIYHYNRLNPSSIVTNMPNSIEIQRQGLTSILVAYNFYQDKEHCYFDLVKRFYVRYLYRMVTSNCRSWNKNGYHEFLDLLLKSEREYWPLIGWDNPIRRFIDCNFYLRELCPILLIVKRKAVSFLRKSLQRREKHSMNIFKSSSSR